MPNPDMLVLMAFPLAIAAIYLYRTLKNFTDMDDHRRAAGPKLLWMIALGGLLYAAWLLMSR